MNIHLVLSMENFLKNIFCCKESNRLRYSIFSQLSQFLLKTQPTRRRLWTKCLWLYHLVVISLIKMSKKSFIFYVPKFHLLVAEILIGQGPEQG